MWNILLAKVIGVLSKRSLIDFAAYGVIFLDSADFICRRKCRFYYFNLISTNISNEANALANLSQFKN